MAVEAALLILVLAAGDPASATAAQAVAEALRGQRSDARVVLAPEAARLLAERGLADHDLIVRSDKPLAVTAAAAKLILIRVERRDSAADHVVVVDLWAGGRWDSSTAIAGGAGDPLPAAADNVRRLLRDAALGQAVVGEKADRLLIASFVERGDWAGLVASVERLEKPSPRLRHMAIVALLRLGDRDGARAALAKLASEAPASPLLGEARAAVEADPGGPEVLRDRSPADDGGNVLR